MAVTLPVIASFIGSWLSGAIVVAITLVVTSLMFIIVFVLRGGPRVAWPSLLVALLLLAIGVVLHVVGGDYGPDNWVYPAAHSVWHIMAMLSLFWIIDIPYKDNDLSHAWCSIGDHSRGNKRRVDRTPSPSTRDYVGVPVQQKQKPQRLSQKKLGHNSKRIELPHHFLFDDNHSTFM